MEYLLRNKEDKKASYKNTTLSFIDTLYNIVWLIIFLTTFIPALFELYQSHNNEELTLLMLFVLVIVVVILTVLHFEKKRYSTPFFGVSDYDLVFYPFSRNRITFKIYDIKEISYEWSHTGIILEIHNHKGFVHNIAIDENKPDIENLIYFINTYTCFSPKEFSYQ